MDLQDHLELLASQGKVLHVSKSKESTSNYVLFRSENEYEPYDAIRKAQWSKKIKDVSVKEIMLTEKGSDKDLVQSENNLGFNLFNLKKDKNV